MKEVRLKFTAEVIFEVEEEDFKNIYPREMQIENIANLFMDEMDAKRVEVSDFDMVL